VQVLEEEYRRLLSVTAAEVRTAVAERLQADRVSVVASLPHGGVPDLDVPRVEAAFLSPIPSRPAAAPTPAHPAPAARAATGRVTAEVLHVPLAGADLLVRRKPGIPLVSLGVYGARTQWETPTDAGIAALAVRSAIRGAGGLDAATLALACERLGGSLAPVASSDWVGLGISALAERAGEAALLLRDAWAEPALRDADVETERALLEEEARQQADDMFRYPFQLAFRAAFGPRGYGLPVGGSVESVRGLTAAAVREWHHEMVAGVRPIVVAVGDVAPDRLAGELAAAFDRGGIAGRPDVRAALAWVGAAAPTVERRDKQQSAFAMVFPGPARRDADRAAAEVWAAVASGLGGRLFEALRDRRSLAYTVLATAWPRARGGALATYIATSPAREEEAREQMLAELARFTEAPPSGRELDQARNYLAGQAEVARQSAGAVLAEIVEAWFAGRGLGDLADPGAEYRAVTGEQVLEVARRYLDPARRGEGVVRGVTALAAAATASAAG
jgi:zinc protease